MIHTFEQNAKWSAAITPQAVSSATTSSYYDMREYGIVAFHCQAAASAANLVCQIYQATTSAGAGAKTMTNGPQSGTVTLTGDGSTAKDDVVECTSRDLDVAGGFDYVAIRVTPSSGSITSCVSAVRSNCRHAAATMPS